MNDWKPAYHKHFEHDYHFSVAEYARELLTLDGTGSLLGSYKITIDRLPDKKLRFVVMNQTGWEPGTRLPFASYRTPSREDVWSDRIPRGYPKIPTIKKPFEFLPKSILNDRLRSEAGWGGNFKQYYFWYEKQ